MEFFVISLPLPCINGRIRYRTLIGFLYNFSKTRIKTQIMCNDKFVYCAKGNGVMKIPGAHLLS